jgi:hypothetical protein
MKVPERPRLSACRAVSSADGRLGHSWLPPNLRPASLSNGLDRRGARGSPEHRHPPVDVLMSRGPTIAAVVAAAVPAVFAGATTRQCWWTVSGDAGDVCDGNEHVAPTCPSASCTGRRPCESTPQTFHSGRLSEGAVVVDRSHDFAWIVVSLPVSYPNACSGSP